MRKAGAIDTKGMGKVLAVPHGEFGLRPFLCPKFAYMTCISMTGDSVCSGYCGEVRDKDAPKGWKYVYCQYAPRESQERKEAK